MFDISQASAYGPLSRILYTSSGATMTFHQKSALTMTAILVVVFGGYFALVLGQIASSPAREITYMGLMVPVIILLVLLAAVSHIVIAIAAPGQVGAEDERDRLINLRGQRVAGYVLAVGTFTGLGLAMIEVDAFWIAQALLAAIVAAEITEGAAKLVMYRRGV